MVQVRERHPVAADGSINVEAWLDRLQADLNIPDIDAVRRACQLAQQAALKPGSPSRDADFDNDCFFAGLEIAEILADLKLDQDTLITAILYRAVREGKLGLHLVETQFGAIVAKLIMGVQQMAAISAVQQPTTGAVLGDSQRQIDNIRKMLVALVDDVRVALIKLAERTWAIRAVKNAPQERKQKVAREVFDIYAPLAHRLGIGHIKWELEDVAFRYLSPDEYKRIAKLLDERRLDRERYIADMVSLLQSRLQEQHIDAVVTGRVKHIYSIWRKMQRKQIDFDQVHDIRAVRVLVPHLKDCYTSLGIVHDLWRHIPKEFDDYIATPKRNGYRSLHTAVIGPEGRTLEVQIRTHEMHEEAEYGVCSHWRYKGTDSAKSERSYEEKIEWLRQVLHWHEEVGDLGSLADELQSDIETNRIYVFTPAGHVVDLARGATPVDFAYRVHTEVGNHCRGAKVNGRIVPLNYQLKTGEQVEILTAKNIVPSRDWLNQALGYVFVGRTRTKIQHWFKLQDRDKNVAAGRSILEKELKRLALDAVDLKTLAPAMNYKTPDDMFAALGAGDLRLGQIVNAAQEQIEPAPQQDELNLKMPSGTTIVSPRNSLEFKGVGNLLSSIANCCKPVPGDECVGYITQGRGISIHRSDCKNVQRMQHDEPDRIIDVQWSSKAVGQYPVDILIRAFDRAGLLRDVTAILANEAVNVTSMNSETDDVNNLVDLRLTLEVSNLEVLGKVLSKINQLPNIIDVKRYKQGG